MNLVVYRLSIDMYKAEAENVNKLVKACIFSQENIHGIS